MARETALKQIREIKDVKKKDVDLIISCLQNSKKILIIGLPKVNSNY